MSDLDAGDQEGNECPTCGKILPTEHGLKLHHAKVHGESLVDTKECEWCGGTFKVSPSQKGERKTCSQDCQMQRRSERGLPGKKRQVEITCANCGKTFSVARSDARTKRYCSMECYRNDRNGKVLECEWCGDEFYAYDSYADKARFCSQDCYGEYLRKHKRGEPRPPYGDGWTETKKEQVRDRDNRTCQDCGLPEEWHKRMYGTKLHVHHIISPRASDGPEEHNAIENLVALCARCHMKREHEGEHGP